VHNPEVLVLDEPTAGVDVDLRTQLWQYVKKLNKENKTTILLTTHYLEEAEELCDEIAIIDNGKVIANGRKEDLLKTLDNKQLEIVVANDIKQIPIALSKRLDIKLTNKNHLVVSYKSGQEDVSDILEMLKNNGMKIVDVVTRQPDLEDVFKYLIKK
jgi:ABC-2 type transport system ATP-binding protein